MKPIRDKNRIFLPLLIEMRPPGLDSSSYHLVCTIWPGKEIVLRTHDTEECHAVKLAYEKCIKNAKAKLFDFSEFLVNYRKTNTIEKIQKEEQS